MAQRPVPDRSRSRLPGPSLFPVCLILCSPLLLLHDVERVLFKYATSSNTPPLTSEVELCGNRDGLQIPEVGGQSSIEIFQPARAVDIRVFDRGNFQSSIQMIVQKVHSSVHAARVWQFRHLTLRIPIPTLSGNTNANQIPRVGVLWIENPAGAPTNQPWIYVKGGFQSMNCKVVGSNTTTTYSFVGGEPSISLLDPDPL